MYLFLQRGRILIVGVGVGQMSTTLMDSNLAMALLARLLLHGYV